MNESMVDAGTRRWDKFVRRIQSGGLAALPAWWAQWVYWNGQLWRALPPATLERMRLAYKYRRLNKKYGIYDPILVYTMGKVGSSSVYRTLLGLDLDVPVYQLHFLNKLDTYERWLRESMPDYDGGVELIELGRRIRDEMERAPQRKWILISMVRAPVPRAVSSFFQNLDGNFPGARERIARNDLTAEELAALFVAQYDDGQPDEWFELQVKVPFGIDVYATEFPKARGYQTYAKDNIRLLVLRMEDLNRCAASALNDFLGIPNVQLVKQNIGEEKEYAELYRQFQQVLRLPPEYVAKWNTSQYAQHFYTEQELADSVRLWTEPGKA